MTIKPIKTKKGLVLYYGGKDQWKVDYPDDEWTGKEYQRTNLDCLQESEQEK